jgi:hypothetical protein
MEVTMRTRLISWITILAVGVILLAACGPISDVIRGDDLDPDQIPTPLPQEPVGSDEDKKTPEDPYDPKAGDKDLQRGEVFIEGSEVLLLESYPVQVRLHVTGDLPTPCHELRAVVNEPDAQSRIEVDLYTVVDPDMICIQVLEPFDANIDIGDFTEGEYTVWVNGEQAGEFSLP